MADAKSKDGALQLALFSLPAAPLFALALPLTIFLPPYYATHLGLPLATVSAVFVAARAFDLFIDPVIGGWEDRTQSRFGRRRLWMAVSAPVLMAFTWFCFDGIWPQAPAALALIGVFGLYAAYAAMLIAHLSWAGELRPHYHGRTESLGALQVTGLFGQVSMLMLAAFVVQSGLGDDGAAVRVMGWCIFAAIPLTLAICLLSTRETQLPPQPHLGFRAALRAILDNVNLRQVLWPDLLTGVAQGVQSGLFLFYFQHVLQFWKESQTLLAIYFVAGLIGAPLWIWLGRRIGKHRALQIACLAATLVAALLPILPRGNFLVVAPLMALGGLPTAAPGILLRAMMADVVDEDELATRARRTGLFFGLLLTTNKIGLVAGPLTYVFLDIAGFNALAHAANSAAALTTLTLLFIALPLALFGWAALSLKSYKLDEARQAATRAAIDARAR